MRLSAEQCWKRVRETDHGVLCTTNASGAIDAVPVCFALVGTRLVSPIDTVKPKATTALGRRTNLDRDPRGTLLCECWDRDDWSRLWWVRARLALVPDHEVDERLRAESEAALRARYSQYTPADFVALLVFDVAGMIGWSASDSQPGDTDPLM